MIFSTVNRRSIAIAILLIFFIDAFASALYMGARFALEDGLRSTLVDLAKASANLYSSLGAQGVGALAGRASVREIFVLDADGNVMYSTDPSVQIGKPRLVLKIDESEIESARQGTAAAGLPYKAEGEYCLRAYAALAGPGEVIGVSASAPSFEALDALERIFWSWVALSILLAGLFVVFYRRAVREVEIERIRAERGERFESLSRMAASVAHEIRNPLNIISATLELRNNSSEKSRAEAEMIADLREEVDRLERVVQDFLDLSREKELQLTNVDANEVSELVVYREERRLATRPEVAPTIRCILGKDVGSFAGDMDRIIQMLANILRNASEACAQGGLIEVRTEAKGNDVIFKIEDSGEGIPELERGAIFEPFLTKKKRGTGLGLAVVKSIVDAHRGSIDVDASHLGGARFTVRLPKK